MTKRLLSLGACVTVVDCLVPEHGGNLANLPSDEPRCQFVRADVCDTQAMEDLVKGCSFLFNMAGQSSHLDSMIDPMADLRFNAQAQLSVLEACRAHNRDVRIVFASTRQLYGKPEYLPVDEIHPVTARKLLF